jgi:hypothetical protein
MSGIHLFHDQSLINFKASEASALASYYCVTSREEFSKFVLGGEFDRIMSGFIHKKDTSQSWLDLLFKLSFRYNNEYISIVRYSLVLNGISRNNFPEYMRFLWKEREGQGYFFHIDKRTNDEFISNLTKVIGSMKPNILRILVGLDEPITKDEIELGHLVTSADKSLQLNTITELYKNNDPKLMRFLDKLK